MFHVFIFDHYYPSGGMNDYSGEFDSIESAREFIKNSWGDEYQIVSNNFEVVECGLKDTL